MVTIDEEVAILRRVPLFERIEIKKLKMLALVCERLRFDAGQLLFRQGDDGDAAYVVLDGTAEILIEDGADATVISTARKNDLVGEIAILCDIRRTATVRATTTLDTIRIAREHFLLLLRESPDAAIEVMRTLGVRLAERTADVTALKKQIGGT